MNDKITILNYIKYILLTIVLLLPFSSSPAGQKNINNLLQPLTPVLPAHPGNKVISLDFLLKLPINYENATVHWLDSSHLVYSTPAQNSKKLLEIGIIDINTKNKIQLDNGLMPKPSPNGQWIAYIREVSGKKQIWIMSRDGKQRKQLTIIANGLTGGPGYHYDFAWSPDSTRLVFFYQPLVEDWDRVKKNADNTLTSSAITAEDLITPLPKTTISLINVANGEMQQLVSIDAKVRYISYFPDGKDLLFLKEREAHRYNQENDETLIVKMHLKDNEIQPLAAIEGCQQSLEPISSPDGKQVAFNYDPDYPLFSVVSSIGLIPSMPISGVTTLHTTKQLTHDLKLSSPKWSPDSKLIYVTRNYGAYDQLYAIDARTGFPKQITHAPLNIQYFDLSPDKTRLAWIGMDAHSNYIIRVASTNGNNVIDLASFSNSPVEMALSEVREIEWSIPGYRVPMRGLLILPLHYQPGKGYPLVTDIHGGDIGARLYLTGGILVSTSLEWQLWAVKGYAVFVPEFRSSGALGSLAIVRAEKEHDLINKDMQDVVDGIDSLIAKGIVDKNRIAVIGHSAGGRRVNWLAVSTRRFKALVSKEGWADEWLISGINPMKRITQVYGSPVLNPENYQKNSPLFHAKGATTPILFLMSSPEKGIDTYSTVRWLYHAIKSQGVETQYVQYPDEGHVLERLANRKDAFERIIKWIDEYIGNK